MSNLNMTQFFLSDMKSALGENPLAAGRDGWLLFLTGLHCSGA